MAEARRTRTAPRMVLVAALAALLAGLAVRGHAQAVPAGVKAGPVDALGLLTGKPYDGTTLQFLICCNTTPQFQALRDRTDREFTPATGIKVVWANIPYVSFLQKIVAESMMGGGSYDTVAWPDAFGPAIRRGVQPLNGLLARSHISMDQFAPVFRAAAMAGDPANTYGLPFRGYPYMLFYRTDVFRQLGLVAPKLWPDYVKDLEAIKAKTQLAPLAGQYDVKAGQNLFTWLAMLWSNGGHLLGPHNTVAFNNPAGLAATELYISFIRRGLAPPQSASWSESENMQAMQQNRAATSFTWGWNFENMVKPGVAQEVVRQHIGFAPVPAWPGKTPISYGYTWLIGMLTSSKHKGASWEYIKWLASAHTEREVAMDKSSPATTTYVTVHTSNMTDPVVNQANFGLPAVEAAALQNARTEPLTPNWPQLQDILAVAINQMAHGADVKATLDGAAHKVAAMLRE